MFLENDNNLNNAHKLIGIDDTVFLSHGNDHFDIASLDSRAFKDVLRESVRDDSHYAYKQSDTAVEQERLQATEQVNQTSNDRNSCAEKNNKNETVSRNSHDQNTKSIKNDDGEKESKSTVQSADANKGNSNSAELSQINNTGEAGQMSDDTTLIYDEFTHNAGQAVRTDSNDSAVENATVTSDSGSFTDVAFSSELEDGLIPVEEQTLTTDEVCCDPLTTSMLQSDETDGDPNQIVSEDISEQDTGLKIPAGMEQTASGGGADKASSYNLANTPVAQDDTVADMPITGEASQEKTEQLNNSEILDNDNTASKSTENNQENVVLRKDDNKPLQMETTFENSPDFSGNKNNDSFNINARQTDIGNGETQLSDVNSDNGLFKNIMDIQHQFDTSLAKTDIQGAKTTATPEKSAQFFDYENNKLFERDLLQQVQAKLQFRASGSAKYSEIKFVLKPEQLGEVAMRMVMQDNTLSARMKVDNETVKTVLEANMEELRKSLAEQGVKVEKVEVVLKNDIGSSGSSGDNRTSNGSMQTEDNQSRGFSNHAGQQNKQSQTEDTSEGLFHIRRQAKTYNNGKIDYLI